MFILALQEQTGEGAYAVEDESGDKSSTSLRKKMMQNVLLVSWKQMTMRA